MRLPSTLIRNAKEYFKDEVKTRREYEKYALELRLLAEKYEDPALFALSLAVERASKDEDWHSQVFARVIEQLEGK